MEYVKQGAAERESEAERERERKRVPYDIAGDTLFCLG